MTDTHDTDPEPTGSRPTSASIQAHLDAKAAQEAKWLEAARTSATDHAFEVGREYGVELAAWVEVDATSGARILQQLEDGDPEVFELFPYPLSGEHAGESILELTDRFGLDLEDEAIANTFEAGVETGFEAELIRRCDYQVGPADHGTSTREAN